MTNELVEPKTNNYRLEDQLIWYDRSSVDSQRKYRALKTLQIIIAALIPVSALIWNEAWVTGAGGALILVLEGLQELGGYHRNWQKYRSTCESLRHEKYLYLGGAGPYANLSEKDAERELTERVESLISEEHTQWIAQFLRQPGNKRTKRSSNEKS